MFVCWGRGCARHLGGIVGGQEVSMCWGGVWVRHLGCGGVGVCQTLWLCVSGGGVGGVGVPDTLGGVVGGVQEVTVCWGGCMGQTLGLCVCVGVCQTLGLCGGGAIHLGFVHVGVTKSVCWVCVRRLGCVCVCAGWGNKK